MIANVIAEIAYISKLINAPATDNVLEALRTLDKEILVEYRDSLVDEFQVLNPNKFILTLD
jgi:hypothetical protein